MGQRPQDPGPTSIVIYDGSCRFCIANAERLVRWSKPGSLRLVSSADPGNLAGLPGVDPEKRDRAIQFIGRNGRISSGAEAIARALNTRPAWRLVTWVYWAPILRQLIDLAYRVVAANRYRIAGRLPTDCEHGACKTPGSSS